MNDTGTPDGYRFIGKPHAAQGRRAAHHRQGPLHRRFQDRRPGLCGDGALALSACADRRRSTAPRRAAMPGVLGVFTGADCLADKLGAIPHDPLPKTKFDMKLSGAGGSAVFIGPQCCCRPTRRVMSARRSPWWWRPPGAGHGRRRGRRRCNTTNCRSC